MSTKPQPFILHLAAAEGEAAPSNNRKISGIAYTGAKVELGFEHPVVVDLEGMEVPGSVPLLLDHMNSTRTRIGLVNPTVEGSILGFTGQIVSGSDDAKEVVAQADAGAFWQLSIGADVLEKKVVKKGKLKANGIEFEAPVVHVTKSKLREISVVAVGADGDTSMHIAASFRFSGQDLGVKAMPEDEKKNEGETDMKSFMAEFKKFAAGVESRLKAVEQKVGLMDEESDPGKEAEPAQPSAKAMEDDEKEKEAKAAAAASGSVELQARLRVVESELQESKKEKAREKRVEAAMKALRGWNVTDDMKADVETYAAVSQDAVDRYVKAIQTNVPRDPGSDEGEDTAELLGAKNHRPEVMKYAKAGPDKLEAAIKASKAWEAANAHNIAGMELTRWLELEVGKVEEAA